MFSFPKVASFLGLVLPSSKVTFVIGPNGIVFEKNNERK